MKHSIGTILVELDSDFRPKVVGEVIQLTACGDWHEECLRLLVDREFSNAHRVRDHLDRTAKIERASDDRPATRVAAKKTAASCDEDWNSKPRTGLIGGLA